MSVHDLQLIRPRDFSFAEKAPEFDRHIRDSIAGLDILRDRCVSRARYYVQNNTTVVDVGCSAGTLLRSIRDANQDDRPRASYVGIDVEQEFGDQWRVNRADNIRFEVGDAREFQFENASLVLDIFTLQFINPLHDRVPLLRRIHEGLIDGGALVVAAKVLQDDARFQEMTTFTYYDHKLQRFSAEEILDKERDLRGVMNCVDEATLTDMLREAGFEAMARFWQVDSFLAFVAEKRKRRRRRR
jgi:tRNA (cmo5U34)-methyltransferase